VDAKDSYIANVYMIQNKRSMLSAGDVRGKGQGRSEERQERWMHGIMLGEAGCVPGRFLLCVALVLHAGILQQTVRMMMSDIVGSAIVDS
jgi:hypothetical protein